MAAPRPKPRIQPICPDCGSGAHAHNFQGPYRGGYWKPISLRLRRHCEAWWFNGTFIEKFKPAKLKPVGKRRERRHQVKPRG